MSDIPPRSRRPSPIPWRGLWRHLSLTLRLNFRSRQPLVYGYLVPVFFLFAFGSVFRSGTPPLLRQMGQLLTITILGGACFGLPTATVAERERGVWRRYRLLPSSAAGILLSTVAARFVLILSAAAMQIVLAWAVYRTPWPSHSVSLAGAFAAAAFAFLGLGVMIAMLADNVPAVQALGQAVFLPMIMIGGVGVPLSNLPTWAQHVAGFLPGRYGVEVLDACIQPEGGGLAETKFALGALVVIGAAGFAAAAGLFRWDAGSTRSSWQARGWVALALLSWVGIGLASEGRRHSSRKPGPAVAAILTPPTPAPVRTPARTLIPAVVSTPVPTPTATPSKAEPWRTLQESDLASIRYDDLPSDAQRILPLAASREELERTADMTRLTQFEDQLAYWAPGTALVEDKAQRVRNLLSACAVADLIMDPNESEMARAVFDRVKDLIPDSVERCQVLAWIILRPTDGTVLTDMSEFNIGRAPLEPLVRERVVGYAKKFLRELRQ